MARYLKSGHLAESSIQEMIVEYIKLLGYGDSVMQMYNEGAGLAKKGTQAMKTGLRLGASDLFIAVANNDKHGFFLEIKSHDGVLSPSQISFLRDMDSRGYYTATVWSFEEGKDELDEYLPTK